MDTKNSELIVDSRQLKEIEFAMLYSSRFNHGTDGHNRLNIVTLFAQWHGFEFDPDGVLIVPPHVTVMEYVKK